MVALKLTQSKINETNTGEGTGGGERACQGGIQEKPLKEVGGAASTWEQPLQYHSFARGQPYPLEEVAHLITSPKDKQLIALPIR